MDILLGFFYILIIKFIIVFIGCNMINIFFIYLIVRRILNDNRKQVTIIHRKGRTT